MTTHTASIRVQPRHCDAQGMVHAARYYEFFEDAFLEWADTAFGGYDALRADGVDLVIVRSSCEHISPARPGDVLDVEVAPAEVGRRAFTMQFVVRTQDGAVATGRTTYVVVRDGKSAEPPAMLAVALADAPRAAATARETARDLLARLHAAQGAFYSGGDDTDLRRLLHPDIAWHVPGHTAIAGHYVGVEAVLDYMRRRRDLADRTFRMHPLELLVGDADHVASLVDGTATIGGKDVSWSTIGLYRIGAGQIVECHLIPFDQEEFDRAWSGPSDAAPPPR